MIHSQPNIPNRERLFERIGQALDARQLSNAGPFVQELECRVAKLHQIKHCVAVSSGTMGLEIAIRALGLEGEVILPSFTFIATAHVLQWLGIKPIFCDVRGHQSQALGHHIDPEKIEELITPHTTGILGVHVWGQSCQVERLEQVAREHNLQLLFDAAHSFGCSIGGDINVLSFHATKVFHTLEGGAILTDDDEIAEKARLLRNFGFTGYDEVACLGINGKMNEVSAAVGLTMLEQLDEIVAANLRNYRRYRAELRGLPGIRLVEPGNNYHYVVVEMDGERAGISRDDLVYALGKEGILARRYFYPGCHRMEPYRLLQPHAGLLLPETERLVERVIALPSGTVMEEGDVIRVCQVIRSYVGC